MNFLPVEVTRTTIACGCSGETKTWQFSHPVHPVIRTVLRIETNDLNE